MFAPKAMDRDPDYIDFVQRMDNAPEETLFSSTEDGLAKLKEGPNVIHALEGRLKGVITDMKSAIMYLHICSLLLPFAGVSSCLYWGPNADVI